MGASWVEKWKLVLHKDLAHHDHIPLVCEKQEEEQQTVVEEDAWTWSMMPLEVEAVVLWMSLALSSILADDDDDSHTHHHGLVMEDCYKSWGTERPCCYCHRCDYWHYLCCHRDRYDSIAAVAADDENVVGRS